MGGGGGRQVILFSHMGQTFERMCVCLILFSGSSGVEVMLTDRPVCLTDVENTAPDSSRRLGSSSEGSDAEDEQNFVSSVVPERTPQPRVHWGNLPKRHDGDQKKAVDPGKEDDDTKCVERCVKESTELLDHCDLSDGPGLTASGAAENVPEPGQNISEVGMSRKGAEELKNLLKNRPGSRIDPPSMLETLRRTLTEWKTEETLRYELVLLHSL